MVIDKILDRKDGMEYNAKAFYNDMMMYPQGHDIAEAMDNGEEEDIKRELNVYVVKNDYNPEICNFINSVKWL
jgi:hypothetical protein